MQIYHNYVRPHETLDGKTPTEACGIVVVYPHFFMLFGVQL